ncbi:MAG: methionyl-tRNA formyltransferase [Candidatus Saccharimonadales bacterium]|nr:methionyl-tRNA formyltransferase [Candidatus Saccharimonadales bacterium]
MARVIFFGNEQLASGITTTAPLLRSLIDNDYIICYIILSQKHVTSRPQKQPAVETIAAQHNIPVLKPDKLSDIHDQIVSSQADVGILAAYGRIVPQETIDLFEHGILNLHPSLLPKYRGSSPIEASILSGDDSTGISLMKLVSEMDAGPVFGFSEVPIAKDATKQQLHDDLMQAGVGLLENLLPEILENNLNPLQQDHDSATYSERLDKSAGQIDWNKPAEQIEREVRAYAGWPGSYSTVNEIKFAVTQATVATMKGPVGTPFEADKQLGIYCGENALIIEKLKPAGKKEMPAEAFLNGYSTVLFK